MRVHRSNRAEELVTALADWLSQKPADPFQRETIIVQSLGMERWLSVELAARLGVVAHLEFPFPRALIERLLEAVLGPEPEGAPSFRPEALAWRVAAWLPELAGVYPDLGRVEPTLAGRLAQARQVAAVLDQYTLQRPELLAEWEAGVEGGFQAALWRRWVEERGGRHPGARLRAAIARLGDGAPLSAALPPRLAAFGVTGLLPLQLSFLAAVSQRVPVEVFVLTPTDQFVADLSTARAASAAEVRTGMDPAALHLDEGHPLLASLGRAGAALAHQLEEIGYQEGAQAFREPGEGTLLHTLQTDLLRVRHRGGVGGPPAQPVAPEDRSLEVHACHSAVREVEVLRDQLLGWLERDPTLHPHHIAVMTPDLETYAPLVEAVFGAEPGAGALPFRIADRAAHRESPVAAAFLAFLALVDGRLRASAVIDLLQAPPVRAALGLEEDEVAVVARVLGAAGVRWGADGEHRAEYDQPLADEHTFRFGLRRVLLGAALGHNGDEDAQGPGEGAPASGVGFGGTLAVTELPAEELDAVGRFLPLFDLLTEARRGLSQPRSAEAWREALLPVLPRLLATEPTEAWQLSRITAALDALVEQVTEASFDEPLPLPALRDALVPLLDATPAHHEFLAGGITVCALVPMRAIPFRVVCLLGLSDDTFPRLDRAPAFDRIAAQPRRGDRSRRDEDRQLFLECLISARQALLITYQGRGVQDNRVRPPSVVVAELLDVLDQGFVPAPGQGQRPWVVHHALQPFDERNFSGDPRRRSFDAETAEAARARRAGQRPPLFLAGPLSPPEAEAEVSLERLARFFDHPVRAFCEERLGLSLRSRTTLVEDREPVELEALDRWHLGDHLLTGARASADPALAEAVARAAGLLPPGPLGTRALGEVLATARELRSALTAQQGGYPVGVRVVDVEVGGCRLFGQVGSVHGDRRVVATFSRVTAARLLGIYIPHLALSLEGAGLTSVLVGREADKPPVVVEFPPLDAAAARATLERLLALRRLGLQAPLPLFRSASPEFVSRTLRGDEDSALASAIQAFEGSPERPWASDALDPYVACALPSGWRPGAPETCPGSAALGVPQFAELAREILLPVMRPWSSPS